MQSPLVDIIVPAYNTERFLAQALDSVLTQSSDRWRIVLVNDGSTDGTTEIARCYAERLGSKMLLIEKANGGLPAARNTAIANSDAPFLALLDADDVWLPDRLRLSLEAFRTPEVGITYGFVRTIDENGKVLGVYDQRNPNAEGDVAPYVLDKSLDMCCPTLTFRRSCVEAVGGFDEKLRATEDRDLWYRIALRYKVALVPQIIAHYRQSPEAMTRDPKRMFDSQMQFLDKHADTADAATLRRARSSVLRQHAEGLLRAGRPAEAARSGLRALAAQPGNSSNWRTSASLLLRNLRPR